MLTQNDLICKQNIIRIIFYSASFPLKPSFILSKSVKQINEQMNCGEELQQ